jgi:hypothetical protein
MANVLFVLAIKVYGGVEIYIRAFLNSEPDEDKRLVSRFVRLIPLEKKRPVSI